MNKKLSVKYLIAALISIIFFGLGAFWGMGVGSAQSDQTDDINTLLAHREYLIKELNICTSNNKSFDGYDEAYEAYTKANIDLAAENKELWEKNKELGIKIAEYDKANAEWADYCTQGGIKREIIYE